MVREVLDDAARERLVSNVVGHLLDGVTEPVLQRAFGYWRNVDKDLGDRSRPASAPARNDRGRERAYLPVVDGGRPSASDLSRRSPIPLPAGTG